MRAYLRRERPYTPGLTAAEVPADAVTTSASGVDPDISEANALIQARRVAKLRGLPLARVEAMVRGHGTLNVNDLNAELRR
jgi:K+-transporting ATPase ATPase C chain